MPDKIIGKVNWVGSFTLFRKEIKRFFKVYQQTILAPAFTSLLFFLVISIAIEDRVNYICLLYTSPSPRDVEESRMPSSA